MTPTPTSTTRSQSVLWFDELGMADLPRVGGKNASLGEMIRALGEAGVRVPGGFATTADAYRDFIAANELGPRLEAELARLDAEPVHAVGERIRALFTDATVPDGLAEAVRAAYRRLSEQNGVDAVDVAVRSSATAEDLPDASFAGQQETFLNVRGEDALLDACRRCFASLFTDRAITYRREKGFDHMKVALSVGVQKMVRSDRGSAGVIFTIDTETGFPDVVVITAAWGLGENVVQGTVTPDEYMVFKPLLDEPGRVPVIERTLGAKEMKLLYEEGPGGGTRNVQTPADERTRFVLDDEELLALARWAVAIEEHYGRPMDIEWAKDGERGELFIVQARPETVQSRRSASTLKTYALTAKGGKRLARGQAIGEAIVAGRACLIESAERIDAFRPGDILITGQTDPDWGPVLKQAAGVITDQGGRTCHAAIVSRELGIPAIVGARNATATIADGQEITLCCAEGDQGSVYDGLLSFEEREVSLLDVPPTRTRILLNIASPAAAFRWWRLPCDGVGLARMEFIINNIIKVHPMALVHPERIDEAARREIARITAGYDEPTEFFVDQLAAGIAKIAASRWPHPVIVRMSDFKTNEYANLIGGRPFEAEEENPMLGFRGASRYYSEAYREGFALECRAIKRVRERIGLSNVIVMIPFCRRLMEADRVLAVMAENGLRRGQDGLEVYVMCEIPSNVILAEQFAERFDGFSIGSNDLTQLVLGVDRDSAALAELFDEQDEAVKTMIRDVIRRAHAVGSKVGICGQAPSDHPEFAAFLVEEGIDSISLTPDSVMRTRASIAEAEKRLAEKGA